MDSTIGEVAGGRWRVASRGYIHQGLAARWGKGGGQWGSILPLTGGEETTWRRDGEEVDGADWKARRQRVTPLRRG
jgi:hypothetical protein